MLSILKLIISLWKSKEFLSLYFQVSFPKLHKSPHDDAKSWRRHYLNISQSYFIVAKYTKLISVAFKKWSFEASLLTQWLSFIPLSLLQTKHFVCNLRLRFGCFVNCLTHTQWGWAAHCDHTSCEIPFEFLYTYSQFHKIEVKSGAGYFIPNIYLYC